MTKTAKGFDIVKTTFSVLTRRATQAISHHMTEKYIKLPSTESDVEQAVPKFYKKYGFPHCIEAIDWTHIPTEKRTEQINSIATVDKV